MAARSAGGGAPDTTRYAPTAIKIIQNWDIPTFPLSGEDLIKEGFTPGPALGDELTRRERVWVDNGFSF